MNADESRDLAGVPHVDRSFDGPAWLRPQHNDRPSPGMEVFVDRLNAACAGPSDVLQPAVLAALAEATSKPDLLREDQQVGCPDRYARHVLYTDPCGRFSVVSLVWGPGQFSPVHGHYTWCGYAVVAGSLREEMYAWEPSRKLATLAGISDRKVRDLCFSYAGLEEVHRLGNGSSERAVSVHVYGVDGPRVSSHVNRLVTSV